MSTGLSQVLQTLGHRTSPEITDEEMAILCTEVQLQRLERLDPASGWALLATILLSPWPSHAVRALRAAGGLSRWLPQWQALFGVPQLSDSPMPVDVGEHQLRVIDQAACCDAPLAVRFASLAHMLGKGGTPREILPHHVKHEQRGQDVLTQWSQRLAIPPDMLELARLAVDEVDRIHRAADVRAGAIAELLTRLQATELPHRFELLLQVCAIDFAAYPGHTMAAYTKAPRMRRALTACLQADALSAGQEADVRAQLRAQAVSTALGSQQAIAR